MLHKASTIDQLHGTQLKRPTALMLKEGCQPRCGASTQVSWAWHLDWLQAAVCAVLFRPALPTQLSCHFAAQQQNEFCIFLFASRATPSAASVAPEMILPAAAAAPLLLTRGMVKDPHLIVCRNVWDLSAGPDNALACHVASLRQTLLCVQTNQGLQGVSQHTTAARQPLCVHQKYVRCYPVSMSAQHVCIAPPCPTQSSAKACST